MFVSRHRWYLSWITPYPSSHNVWLAWPFPMKWQSKRFFCIVLIDETYQPWHKRLSMPPCGPYLATSNISPNNKVNTRYNGLCSVKESFATSGRQIWQIDKALNTTTASRKWWQEWLAGRKCPSIGSIAQITIQKEAFCGETMGNALFMQQRTENRSRIMWIESPQWQENKFKT